MSTIKIFIANLFISFLFVYLTYTTWLNLGSSSIPIIIICAIIVCIGLTFYLRGKQNAAKIEQYRILLEYLSSRISSGHTLESVLLEAYSRLKHELGLKSTLSKCLKQLEQAMHSHLDLDRCLEMLKKNFNCQTSDAFFDVLPYLNHYGGRLDIFIKQTYKTLNAEIQMQKDIAAEQNAQKSETLILIFLPFLFSFVLIKQGTTYSQALVDVSWSKIILAAIFILSHIAIFISLLIIAKNPLHISNKDIYIEFKETSIQSRFIIFLSQFLLTNAPLKFGYNLSESVRILSQNQNSAWLKYNQRKCLLCFFVLIFASLLYAFQLISISVIFISFFGFWLLQDLDIFRRENKLKEQIRIEYPTFLNSMVVLLRSGLSLEKSLRLMIDSVEEKVNSQLKTDLLKIRHHLSVGDSASYALSSITESLPQEEIASILQLFTRYERDGGKEILDILDIQANSSWQLYRNAMRQRLQNKNMGLLLPMTIDLFIVIIMAMLPAIASLGNITI